MDTESLVDKLGFHFSKKANGGGDVEMCQVLEDTRTAVITFSDLGSEDCCCCSQAPLSPPLLTLFRLSLSCRPLGAQTVSRHSGAGLQTQSEGDALRQRPDEQTRGDRLSPASSLVVNPKRGLTRTFSPAGADAGLFSHGAAEGHPRRPEQGHSAGVPG